MINDTGIATKGTNNAIHLRQLLQLPNVSDWVGFTKSSTPNVARLSKEGTAVNDRISHGTQGTPQ